MCERLLSKNEKYRKNVKLICQQHLNEWDFIKLKIKMLLLSLLMRFKGFFFIKFFFADFPMEFVEFNRSVQYMVNYKNNVKVPENNLFSTDFWLFTCSLKIRKFRKMNSIVVFDENHRNKILYSVHRGKRHYCDRGQRRERERKREIQLREKSFCITVLAARL